MYLQKSTKRVKDVPSAKAGAEGTATKVETYG